jgi:hypothetical protein
VIDGTSFFSSVCCFPRQHLAQLPMDYVDTVRSARRSLKASGEYGQKRMLLGVYRSTRYQVSKAIIQHTILPSSVYRKHLYSRFKKALRLRMVRGSRVKNNSDFQLTIFNLWSTLVGSSLGTQIGDLWK